MAVDLLLWAGFSGLILLLLLVDLLVFHRRAHEVTLRESLTWTVVWIALALAFGAGVWLWLGAEKGLEYYTGYVIEKSLSVDNLFVFLLIFTYFRVPKRDEHKVLFWGIAGALAFRVLFILAGVALIEHFHWVLYLFGGLLVAAAARMVFRKAEGVHPERNPVLRLARRLLRLTPDYRDDRFFVRVDGRLCATPLLVVLLVVETTDIVFALDSLPAIFAITLDPFIVFTSNAFAILGLRALYFALEGVLTKLRYLHYGLAALLAFVAAKIFLSDFVKIPVQYALGVVGGVLLVTVLASLRSLRQGAAEPAAARKAPAPAATQARAPEGRDPTEP